jgi:hypothetical protein
MFGRAVPCSGMETLPLSYLIDALAQLDLEISSRAVAHRVAGRDELRRARDEARAADDAFDDSWVAERTEWYQAVGPLRALCLQRLERELEQEHGAPRAEQLLASLVAVARRRVGGAIDVDTALGR